MCDLFLVRPVLLQVGPDAKGRAITPGWHHGDPRVVRRVVAPKPAGTIHRMLPGRPAEPSSELGGGLMLVQVITGTTREGRFSERVAGWVVDHLGARDDLEVELVDLRDHPLPFFDGTAPARTLRDYPRRTSPGSGRRIDRADGYIVLTAEYNHGYPAVLKNAMDWTFVEWRRKPITFVGWGNVGGARAIEQLREVAVEFEMAPLRYAVHILADVMIAEPGRGPRRPVAVRPARARLTCSSTTSCGGPRRWPPPEPPTVPEEAPRGRLHLR